MVKITEKPEEIIIRYVPVKEWIVAGILTFLLCFCSFWLFCFIFLTPQAFLGENLKSWLDGICLILILFIIIIITSSFKVSPIFHVFRVPFTILKINQQAKNIEIFRQWIYRRQIDRHYFSQISKFKSNKVTRLFIENYLLNLVLANQKEIKLEIPVGDKKAAVNLVRKFNKIIKDSSK